MKQQIDSNRQSRQNMNWDEAGNDWETFKQHLQQRWQSLSDEQLAAISGRRERLSQELQRTYQLSAGEAESEIEAFETGSDSVAGTASGRGPTERTREFGTGNDQGTKPRNDKHDLH